MGAADWLIQASKHVELGARCPQDQAYGSG
jgi:hypothetical protein